MIMIAAGQDGVNADSVERADEQPNLSETRFPTIHPLSGHSISGQSAEKNSSEQSEAEDATTRLTSTPEQISDIESENSSTGAETTSKITLDEEVQTEQASNDVSDVVDQLVKLTLKDEYFSRATSSTFSGIQEEEEESTRGEEATQPDAMTSLADEQSESWLRRNMRFSTKHFWKKAGVVILGTLSLFHAAAKTHKAMKLDAVREQASTPYEPAEEGKYHFSSDHRWSENSKRYAGTSQEVGGMSWVSYTGNLESALRSGNFQSLEEAHQYLEQEGVTGLFHYSPQVPVSSSGSDLGWKIGETQDRRVIVIQGEGHAGGVVLHALGAADGQTFSRDAQRMTSIAKDVFEVAPEHIYHLSAPTVKEVNALLKEIGKTCSSDTEVMFYYVGHALANEASARGTGQGAFNGTLCLGEHDGLLSEDELKDMSVEHMSGVKTFSVVLDACYTGSFIY